MATETTSPSLAFDLARTDLSQHGELSRLVIDHTIAPVRALAGLPPPQRGEGRSFMFGESWFENGVEFQPLRRMDLPRTSACFDQVVRALLLFGWLFPRSLLASEGPQFVLDSPGSAVLDDYWHLADRPQEAIEDLVAGLLGQPADPPLWRGSRPHVPEPNPSALDELARAQELVWRAIGPVDDEEHTVVVDIGLDRMDWLTSREIDQEIRLHVHRRLVWFGTMEPIPGEDDDVDGSGGILTYDRGVFAAQVPDSLTGLVLLDFSESLARDRSAAWCGHCNKLMQVNARQAARARKGFSVFHADCLGEHRLGYFRRKSQERYRRVKASQAS